MLVKLQDMDKKVERDQAFKVVSYTKSGNKTTKYYSSEEAYNHYVEQLNFKAECIEAIKTTLGYEDFMKIPSYFYKKLKEWDGYGYEVITECIKDCYDSIQWALRTKNFTTEVNKLIYICKIIENNLNDTLKKHKRTQAIIKASHSKEEAPPNYEETGRKKVSGSDASNFLSDIW